MPYTVKAVTTWSGTPPLSTAEQIAGIRALYSGDYTEHGFNPAGIIALRHAVTVNGDMLARGSVISVDGLSITTTTVWTSQETFTAYEQDPASVSYIQAMRDGGWNIEVTKIG